MDTDALDKSVFYSKEDTDGYFAKCADTSPVTQEQIDEKCLPKEDEEKSLGDHLTVATDKDEVIECKYKTKTEDIDYDSYATKCEKLFGPSYQITEYNTFSGYWWYTNYTYCCEK